MTTGILTKEQVERAIARPSMTDGDREKLGLKN